MQCTTQSQCPSGYDCGGVIFQCTTGEGGPCPPDPNRPGVTMTCQGFLVENEIGTQFYCADPSHQPNVYFRACAPISGFCPADALP